MIEKIATKELADFLEISGGFASQIKSGHRKLPPKYCVRVSQKFGIPLHKLRPDIFPDNGKPSNTSAIEPDAPQAKQPARPDNAGQRVEDAA
jgi:DNA-binding transcriptional regulator YdaS (Cro superfamily)